MFRPMNSAEETVRKVRLGSLRSDRRLFLFTVMGCMMKFHLYNWAYDWIEDVLAGVCGNASDQRNIYRKRIATLYMRVFIKATTDTTFFN